MTKVKFYIEDKENNVFAYFPDIEYYAKGCGFDERTRTCYAHIGQHSACSPDYLKGKKLAKYHQYFDLLRELIGQGYNDLEVVNLKYQSTDYHRPPTQYEIKFGEGATHYREFKLSEIGINKKGNLKQWFISPDDKLRYNSY